MALILTLFGLTVVGSALMFLILQEWRWLSQFNEWLTMIDVYIINRIISDISIEIPNNFLYPYLAIIGLGMLTWLGRLDVLAMRAYLRWWCGLTIEESQIDQVSLVGLRFVLTLICYQRLSFLCVLSVFKELRLYRKILVIVQRHLSI